MIEAKQLTTNSWLIKDSGFSIGFIYKESDGLYKALTTTETLEFDTFDNTKKYFGKKVKEILASTIEIDDDIKVEINGYPVKHDNITIKEEGSRPIYQRVNSVYAAGYWTIKYSDVWVAADCPLLSTVESYPCNGPFRTKLEMLSQIATNNKLNM